MSTPKSRREDQKARIKALRTKLRFWVTVPGMDPDSEEQLLRDLLSMEGEAETRSTLARQLIADGIELPDPGDLPADQVHDKLWEVLHGMAHRCHVLERTDHLTDLELYDKLWREVLNDPAEDTDRTRSNCITHIDLVDCEEFDPYRVHLQYYAEEWERAEWLASCPGRELPPVRERPADRDRKLPRGH